MCNLIIVKNGWDKRNISSGSLPRRLAGVGGGDGVGGGGCGGG